MIVVSLCLLFFGPPKKSLEMSKISAITEKFQKIEEAAKSREEQNLNFSKQAEQKLQSKMESNKENRNNHLNALKEKLKKTVIDLFIFEKKIVNFFFI